MAGILWKRQTLEAPRPHPIFRAYRSRQAIAFVALLSVERFLHGRIFTELQMMLRHRALESAHEATASRGITVPLKFGWERMAYRRAETGARISTAILLYASFLDGSYKNQERNTRGRLRSWQERSAAILRSSSASRSVTPQHCEVGTNTISIQSGTGRHFTTNGPGITLEVPRQRQHPRSEASRTESFGVNRSTETRISIHCATIAGVTFLIHLSKARYMQRKLQYEAVRLLLVTFSMAFIPALKLAGLLKAQVVWRTDSVGAPICNSCPQSRSSFCTGGRWSICVSHQRQRLKKRRRSAGAHISLTIGFQLRHL